MAPAYLGVSVSIGALSRVSSVQSKMVIIIRLDRRGEGGGHPCGPSAPRGEAEPEPLTFYPSPVEKFTSEKIMSMCRSQEAVLLGYMGKF